ncbi:MAG TPA: hypothetical protein PKG48_05415 [Bacteroidales bacterium]|nr:hypothetical protein [Bacteroidales bacterium]HPS62045.1 hypothetical protein [Bacteroidales bacterium]
MSALKTNIVWLFLLLATGVSGQQVGVSASLDTTAMLIGDHVGLTLKFTGPAGTQVAWPQIPDTIIGSITVIGRGRLDTTFTPDKKTVTYRQQINLTCYDSGFYTIPPISFPHRVPPDTTRLVASSAMMMLAVHTVRVDTTQAIKPIAGPLRIPLSFREILPWLLAGITAAALIAGGIWYWRRRRKHEPILVLKPKVVLPPHVAALQDLEKLRVKKLWQAGRIKEYHTELTEILRLYIEDRFDVPALEQTTFEIKDSLRNREGCAVTSLEKLGSLLTLADMVKFAKVQPLAMENEQSLQDGIDFIHETKQG